MAKIDAHQHFWWVANRAHTWPESVGTKMDRDFTPDDLRPELARAGVDGTVLVQSLNDIDECREYLVLARDNAIIRGVVGWIPLTARAVAERALAALPERHRLVGIRHLISYEPDPDWLLQPGVVDSLALLAEEGLAYDAVPMNFRQLETVFAVARRLPELKIVINHLLRPPIPDQGWEPWAAIVTQAAALPNMFLKLSPGVDLLTRWHWSTPMAARYFDHLLGRFGPGRLMAASNWPVVLINATFGEVWDGIATLVSGLSKDEQSAVLGGTAERIYGLR